CDVWAADANASDALIAGIVLNEQRKAHGCVHVARRLREIKNTYGLTGEELAQRTGLPLDRVKTYLALFGGSDALLSFFEGQEISLKVAAEFMRYEKATNEACAKRLIERFLETPL